jgi:uncharacterized protein YkwD
VRPTFSASLLGILLALVLSAPAGSTTVAASATERALLAEVNRVRAARGLPALRNDWRLARAARAHTASMLASKRFAHGDTVARLRRFGVRGGHVGENLAWGSGRYSTPAAIVRMWLASPPHRANLLRRSFRRVGLSAAAGAFAGYSSAVVVTADFVGT